MRTTTIFAETHTSERTMSPTGLSYLLFYCRKQPTLSETKILSDFQKQTCRCSTLWDVGILFGNFPILESEEQQMNLWEGAAMAPLPNAELPLNVRITNNHIFQCQFSVSSIVWKVCKRLTSWCSHCELSVQSVEMSWLINSSMVNTFSTDTFFVLSVPK